MAAHHRRILQPDDELRLFNALKEARREATIAAGSCEIGGDLYTALERFTKAVDDVVEVTGRPRDHFWTRANSA